MILPKCQFHPSPQIIRAIFHLKSYSPLSFFCETFECNSHKVTVPSHPKLLEENTSLSYRRKIFCLSSDLTDGLTRKRRHPPIFINKNSNYSIKQLLNTDIIKQKGKWHSWFPTPRLSVRMSWLGMKFVLGPYAYNLTQNILSSGC